MDDEGENRIPAARAAELAGFFSAHAPWLFGHPSLQQRAWLLSTLAHKDIRELRHQEIFRRRQPDILALYRPTAADAEAEARNAIALARARAREII